MCVFSTMTHVTVVSMLYFYGVVNTIECVMVFQLFWWKWILITRVLHCKTIPLTLVYKPHLFLKISTSNWGWGLSARKSGILVSSNPYPDEIPGELPTNKRTIGVIVFHVKCYWKMGRNEKYCIRNTRERSNIMSKSDLQTITEL